MDINEICETKKMDVSIIAFDNLNLFIDQARAMSHLASGTDFQELTQITLSDYWGVVIEILEQARDALNNLLQRE